MKSSQNDPQSPRPCRKACVSPAFSYSRLSEERQGGKKKGLYSSVSSSTYSSQPSLISSGSTRKHYNNVNSVNPILQDSLDAISKSGKRIINPNPSFLTVYSNSRKFNLPSELGLGTRFEHHYTSKVFSGESLTERSSKALLGKSGEALHDTVDHLCGYPVDFVTDYDSEGLRLFKFMKKTIKDLMAVEPGINELGQKLVEEYRCDSIKAQKIAEHFLIRRKDIQNYMSNLILSENKLSNFNWSVSLVMSSAQKATLKEPLLHLQLEVENGFDKRRVLLEFNYEELCQFIDQVDQVKDRCLGYN